MSTPCPALICEPPNDLSYSLQGLNNPLSPVAPFTNAEVRWCCPDGETLSFTGTLPSWITISGDCLVGAAGKFFGNNQAVATQLAQNALDNFAIEQQDLGNLVCSAADVCDPDALPVLDADISTGSDQLRGCVYVPTVDRIFVGESTGSGGSHGTKIFVIDPATNTIENTITIATSLAIEQMAYSATSDKVYAAVAAASGHDFVAVINPLSLSVGSVGPSIDFDHIWGLTWDSTRNQIYAGWEYGGSQIGIVPVDCATDTIIVARELTINVWGSGNLIYCPGNDTVYMSIYNGGVDYVNPTTMVVSGNISMAGHGTFNGADNLGYSALASIILARCYGTFEVAIIDPTGNTVSQYIDTNPRLFYGNTDTECRLEWASGLIAPGTYIEFRKPDLSSVGLLAATGNPGDPAYCTSNKRVYVPGSSSVRVIGPT